MQLQVASGRSAAPRSPFAAIGARAAEPPTPCPQPCSRHGSGRDARGQPPAAVPCGGSPARSGKALIASQNVLPWLPAQNGDMERICWNGHASMLGANTMWGLMSPISKMVMAGSLVTPFVVTELRVAGAMLLFWAASFFTKSEHVSARDHQPAALARFFYGFSAPRARLSGRRAPCSAKLRALEAPLRHGAALFSQASCCSAPSRKTQRRTSVRQRST